MIEIPLTKGKVAIVDDCDSDIASKKWWFNQSGYAVREEHSKVVLLHRIILERKIGRPLERGELCDHVDSSSKLDNRRDNLRVASRSQNMVNSRRKRASGYRGVYPSRRGHTWTAYIAFNGKSKYLGSFPSAEEAHKAYCAAAKELHGEFARFD